MDLMQYEDIEEKYKDDIAKVMRYLWPLWSCAFITVPTLVGMSIIRARFWQEAVTPSDSLGIFIPVFSIIAIGSQIAAVVLRNGFLSGKMNTFFKLCLRLSGNKDSEFEVLCLLGLFLPVVISSMPASLGAFLLTMDVAPWLFYAFVIFGAIGMIYHRPQKDLIVEYIINEQKV